MLKGDLARDALPRVRRPGVWKPPLAELRPAPNSAKLRSVWDGFMPRRGYGAQLRVSTLGTIQPKRVALNGRKITWAKEKHLATWDTLPVPGSPTLRHRPRWRKQSPDNLRPR